jgi:hypothetical protein
LFRLDTHVNVLTFNMWIIIFGFGLLSVTNDNEMMKKKRLFVWKLSFIWMKILNNIACNLNWKSNSQIEFKYIEWNSIFLIELKWVQIQLRQINSNSIEWKWDINWCTRYWKRASIIHDYSVEKKQLWKDTNSKRHLSIPSTANSKSKSSWIKQDY